MVQTMYGLQVSPEDNRIVAAFEKGIESVHLVVTGALFEHFPILARLPTWLPGTAAIRNFEEARRLTAELRDIPWNEALKNLVSKIFPLFDYYFHMLLGTGKRIWIKQSDRRYNAKIGGQHRPRAK